MCGLDLPVLLAHRAREDVDQVSLEIAEDHAPVPPRLVRFWGEGATMVSLSGDNQAMLLGFIDRKLTAVLALNMRGERIQSVQVIADPFLLGFVAAQLPVLA